MNNNDKNNIYMYINIYLYIQKNYVHNMFIYIHILYVCILYDTVRIILNAIHQRFPGFHGFVSLSALHPQPELLSGRMKQRWITYNHIIYMYIHNIYYHYVLLLCITFYYYA